MKTKRVLFLILTLAICLAILCSCTVVEGEGEGNSEGENEAVGTVTVVIDEKIITKPAQYDSLHSLLLDLKASGEISRYEYNLIGDIVEPVAIDKYKDKEDGNLLIYHNIEDNTLYTTNHMMKKGDVTFRCSIVDLKKLPVVADVEYIIVCE